MHHWEPSIQLSVQLHLSCNLKNGQSVYICVCVCVCTCVCMHACVLLNRIFDGANNAMNYRRQTKTKRLLTLTPERLCWVRTTALQPCLRTPPWKLKRHDTLLHQRTNMTRKKVSRRSACTRSQIGTVVKCLASEQTDSGLILLLLTVLYRRCGLRTLPSAFALSNEQNCINGSHLCPSERRVILMLTV